MATGAYVSEWDKISMMRAVQVVWLLKYVSADQVCNEKGAAIRWFPQHIAKSAKLRKLLDKHLCDPPQRSCPEKRLKTPHLEQNGD